MAAVLEQLAYHHWLWRRFADFYVEKCSWEELSTDRDASYHSIAQVTLHAAQMEDWWLNHLRVNKPYDGPAWGSFRNAEAMRQRILDVERKTNKLVAAADERRLAESYDIDCEGVKVKASLEELLWEVLSEGDHHRGEVIAMLWQLDKEPPFANYLEFLGRYD